MDDQEIQDGAQPSVCLAKVRQRHGAERRKSTAPGTLEKMKERIEVRRAAEEKKKENLLRDQDVSVYRVRVSSSLFCYDSGIPLKPVPGAVEKICGALNGSGRRLPSMAGNARSQSLSNNRSYSTGFAPSFFSARFSRTFPPYLWRKGFCAPGLFLFPGNFSLR